MKITPVSYLSNSISPKKPTALDLPIKERIGGHLSKLSAVEKAKANMLLGQKTSDIFDKQG